MCEAEIYAQQLWQGDYLTQLVSSEIENKEVVDLVDLWRPFSAFLTFLKRI